MRKTYVALATLVATSWLTANAYAAPEVFPLDKVKRGQTGYGLTTMKGYTPEKFSFEVVSVVKNFLPKQDIILVKSEDPKLAVSGFWQGMSGSPLYIDGKVACAFSYGFRFNKIALGGCTPIQYMIDDAKLPRRGPGGALGEATRVADHAVTNPAAALAGRPTTLPTFPKLPTVALGGETLRAGVPIAVGGFSEAGFAALQSMFKDTGIEPMRGGAVGAAGTANGQAVDPASPKKFEMGSSIAVLLMRGDMSMAATGTVSWVDGNSVLAFGHPFFGAGEGYMPVAVAEVHTVIPSAQSAFVMASPQREIGSLWSDRQSSIAADLALRSPMIPMDIRFAIGRKEKSQKGTFSVELVSNKFFTGQAATAALANAISYYLPDRDNVTVLMKSTLKVKGIAKPLEFVDAIYANDGAGMAAAACRGVRIINPILMNPWRPAEIEKVDVTVELGFDTNYGEIKEVRLPTNRLAPGKRNFVTVVLETYNGEDIVEQVPVDVPADLAGALIALELAPGDATRLDAPPATDLASAIESVRKVLPANVWAASIYVRDGIAYEGKALHDVPASVEDKLRPMLTTQKVQSFSPVVRTITPATRALSGKASIMVRVADR